MTVSASGNSGYSDPNQLVPVFPSENAQTAAEANEAGAKQLTLFQDGDDSPSFWDLLDVINPLQHIPVVNTLYQELTGDKIGVGARLAGDTLFGGAIGLVASVVNCLVEESTGDDIGGHVMALFKGDGDATTLAQADSPAGASGEAKAAAGATPAPATTTATAESTAPAITLPEADNALVATLRATQPMSFATTALGTGSEAASAASLATATAATGANIAAAMPTLLAAADTAGTTAAPAAAALTNTAHPLHATPARGQAKTAAANRSWAPPARTAIESDKAPPPITVPISTNGSRSNMLPVGRPRPSVPTTSAQQPDPIALERAMAQQGLSGVKHPMLPDLGKDVATPTAGATPATGSGSADWMQSMNQALDKYQKANNLAARRDVTATTGSDSSAN